MRASRASHDGTCARPHTHARTHARAPAHARAQPHTAHLSLSVSSSILASGWEVHSARMRFRLACGAQSGVVQPAARVVVGGAERCARARGHARHTPALRGVPRRAPSALWSAAAFDALDVWDACMRTDTHTHTHTHTHTRTPRTHLVVHDLLGLDLNVHGLTRGATQRLVDHDARIGHAVRVLRVVRCALCVVRCALCVVLRPRRPHACGEQSAGEDASWASRIRHAAPAGAPPPRGVRLARARARARERGSTAARPHLWRFPRLPAASRNAPMDAARPKQCVCTSARHSIIAS
jgi:hypothetical protein